MATVKASYVLVVVAHIAEALWLRGKLAPLGVKGQDLVRMISYNLSLRT